MCSRKVKFIITRSTLLESRNELVNCFAVFLCNFPPPPFLRVLPSRSERGWIKKTTLGETLLLSLTANKYLFGTNIRRFCIFFNCDDGQRSTSRLDMHFTVVSLRWRWGEPLLDDGRQAENMLRMAVEIVDQLISLAASNTGFLERIFHIKTFMQYSSPLPKLFCPGLSLGSLHVL